MLSLRWRQERLYIFVSLYQHNFFCLHTFFLNKPHHNMHISHWVIFLAKHIFQVASPHRLSRTIKTATPWTVFWLLPPKPTQPHSAIAQSIRLFISTLFSSIQPNTFLRDSVFYILIIICSLHHLLLLLSHPPRPQFQLFYHLYLLYFRIRLIIIFVWP